jgi:Tol biopolymer transport system component
MTAVLDGFRLPPRHAASGCGEDDVRVQLFLGFSAFLQAAQPGNLAAAPATLTSNLEAAPVFRPFLDKMWQSSPTFREQCRRLGAETGLRVSVLLEDRPGRTLSFHARTVLSRKDGSLVTAQVYLKPELEAAELIAHELEHILEQLDGVDLKAQAGNGIVWKSGDDTFETQRAIEAGRRVAREVTGSGAGGFPSGLDETATSRVATVAQRDRDAAPTSARSARVSGSGRHIVFVSFAQLADADRNQLRDVYVHDLGTGQYTLESVAPGGASGNGESVSPGISNDGRYVVFESAAGNLTDTPFPSGVFHVFLRDREKGTTRLLTTNANGEPANGLSGNPVISADGTAVAFESVATDLIATHESARITVGIYLIQLPSGVRTRLDVTSAGRASVGPSASPAISADGRFSAFVSKVDLTCGQASACVTEPSDENGIADIYLRDAQTGTTKRVTRSYSGGDPDGPSYDPAISGDGRHLTFVSEASNLTRDQIKRTAHIYVQDLATGITELVTRTPGGRPANGPSLHPTLSHDGSRIAFQSLACNLVCEGKCHDKRTDINLLWDVFVYDRSTRRTTWVSTDIREDWMENSRAPSLDGTGHVVAFGSRHPINGRDEGRDEDMYVYRLR